MCFTTSVGGVLCTKFSSLFTNMIFFKLFVKLYSTIFLFFILTATMAPVTLTKTFDLKGIQYIWNPNDNYGWMSDTLGGKFNFYYRVGDMVTDGILDAGRKKISDDIMTKLQT